MAELVEKKVDNKLSKLDYMVFAVAVMWFAMIAVMFQISLRTYGGLLDTGAAYVWVAPVVFISEYFSLRFWEQKWSEQELWRRKIGIYLKFICAFGLCVVCFVGIYFAPYLPWLYYAIPTLVLLAFLYKHIDKILMPKPEYIYGMLATILVYAAGILLTLAMFCVIVHPVSVKEGRQHFEDLGYTNVKCYPEVGGFLALKMNTAGDGVYDGYDFNYDHGYGDDLHYYVFQYCDDEMTYHSVMEVATGKIVLTAPGMYPAANW